MENQTPKKIIEIIQRRGPSLPMSLAKELRMNSLFISAFLSELASEKKVKVSHLKVGGSPLYFIEGQEEKLEPFHTYLPQKEIEAFQLLKLNNILKDAEQEPAIRVALRSIRDFAVGFKKDNEIYWRDYLISEEEVERLLEPKQKVPEIKKEIIKPKPKVYEKKPKQEVQQIIPIKQKKPREKEETFQNPLVIQEEKPEKQKQKSEFVQKTINLLNQKFKILEEKDYKSKEYNCILQINSELGTINLLTSAKDKKTISEADLKKLLSDAQKIPLSAFLLYTGTLSKKAKEYLNKYSSILKAKKII